jgi:hypothetical protein
MNFARFSLEQKVGHLLQWTAGWSGEEGGESMWSYSLRLGGSHALLNGWAKDRKVMNALTSEEQIRLALARRRSAESRRRKIQFS